MTDRLALILAGLAGLAPALDGVGFGWAGLTLAGRALADLTEFLAFWR